MAVCLAGCSARDVERAPAGASPIEREVASTSPEVPFALAQGLSARTPVLTYHDVIASRDSDSVWFDCTVDELVSQLDWLEDRGAAFVSTEDLYRHLAEGAHLPPRAIVVTFADNYAGFLRYAWPELRRRHIPVTFFVHTAFVGSRVGRPKLDWDQLRDLAKDPLISIQSQTETHPADLRELDDETIDREMSRSKRMIEAKLGKTCAMIAYPNGKYDERAVNAAMRARYKMAFSEVQHPAETSPNLFEVGRYVHTKMKKAWNDAYGTSPP